MKLKKILIVAILIVLAIALVAQIHYSYSKINFLEDKLEQSKKTNTIDNDYVIVKFNKSKDAVGYYTITLVNKNMDTKLQTEFTEGNGAAVVYNESKKD